MSVTDQRHPALRAGLADLQVLVVDDPLGCHMVHELDADIRYRRAAQPVVVAQATDLVAGHQVQGHDAHANVEGSIDQVAERGASLRVGHVAEVLFVNEPGQGGRQLASTVEAVEIGLMDLFLEMLQVQRVHARSAQQWHVSDQQVFASLGGVHLADDQPVGTRQQLLEKIGVCLDRQEIWPGVAFIAGRRCGVQGRVEQLRAFGEEALERGTLLRFHLHVVVRVEHFAVSLQQGDQQRSLFGRHRKRVQRIRLGGALRQGSGTAGRKPERVGIGQVAQGEQGGFGVGAGRRRRRAGGQQAVFQRGQGIQHGQAPCGGTRAAVDAP